MRAVTTLLSRSTMKRVRDVDEIAAGGHPFSLFLSPSLCLFHLHKGSGSYVHLCPRPCFDHASMGQTRNPTQRTTQVRTPCSGAHIGLQPPHVCHRQRDWAVSVGSHMQQNMGISQAPPHLRAPLLLFDAVYVRKQRSKKMAMLSPETWLSFLSFPTRVFRSLGRHKHRAAHMHMQVTPGSRINLINQLMWSTSFGLYGLGLKMYLYSLINSFQASSAS